MPSLRVAVLIFGLGTCIGSAEEEHAVVVEQQFRVPDATPDRQEVEQRIKRLQLPSGWKAEVWASEPDVIHPVAFDVTDDGRVFVAESLRAWRGVQDIRPLQPWLDEDLAVRTPDDRLAMMRRHLGAEGLKPFSRNTERIRLLQDTNGDGRADRAQVFADGFRTELDGVASSVLVRGHDVWFANIPNVWHLRDQNGDGIADERRSLSYGHGVRISMLGHDLHGLAWGPDGRIYVSVGDRGSRVFHQGKWIGNPDCGSVFRFEPDGSGLEVFASGLRNPQELVFDDEGYLFTGDNSANTGDQSRWVQVVEGSDSGWHIGWQWAENPAYNGSGWREGASGPGALAPWNTELMWHPATNGQPAYLLPPVANISAGPCGAARYPGAGLDAAWDGTFVLGDFRGGADGSGYWRFKLKPRGAGFELVESSKFIWNVNSTDGCWGPDGAFWLTDWTDGWEPEGRGRIYRCFDPDRISTAEVRQTRDTLALGFDQLTTSELIKSLNHPHQRIRQAAQFNLASRGPSIIPAVIARVETKAGRLGRLHALWAFAQVTRAGRVSGDGTGHDSLGKVISLLGDADVGIRRNAAQLLGDLRHRTARQALIQLLYDSAAPVRAEAAMALGKLADPSAVPALAELIRNENDRDPVIRHAAVMGLLGCADPEQLLTLSTNASASVRLAVVVAFRRLERSELGRFLNDPDHRIIQEAARAIHDIPVAGALADLAELADRSMDSGLLARRIINANLRIGTRETAQRLAGVAADSSKPASVRTEALLALAAWQINPGRDRVTGLWRPTPFQREADAARSAFEPKASNLLHAPQEDLRIGAIQTIAALGLNSQETNLVGIVVSPTEPAALRVESLRALDTLRSPLIDAVVDRVFDDRESSVRELALGIAARGTGPDAPARLRKVLVNGAIGDRQAALQALGKLRSPAAIELLGELLAELIKGRVQQELQVDLLEAAERQSDDRLAELLAQYRAGLPGKDPLSAYRPALAGGRWEAGRKVFHQKVETECIRCHKVFGQGGEVGPELTEIGAKRDAAYLLASIIRPNDDIADGYVTTLFGMKDGDSIVGTIKSESTESLEVLQPDGTIATLKKNQVKTREHGLSAMPDGFGAILNLRELRDLVAFLQSLR